MPRPTIEFHPAAVAEARAARAWYEARSPAAAEAFMAELDAVVARIVEAPERHGRYLRGTRACLLHRFPYMAVFCQTETGVEIVAVAHGRRRPGYWTARLTKPR
jgi:toxin ParE1/3/4